MTDPAFVFDTPTRIPCTEATYGRLYAEAAEITKRINALPALVHTQRARNAQSPALRLVRGIARAESFYPGANSTDRFPTLRPGDVQVRLQFFFEERFFDALGDPGWRPPGLGGDVSYECPFILFLNTWGIESIGHSVPKDCDLETLMRIDMWRAGSGRGPAIDLAVNTILVTSGYLDMIAEIVHAVRSADEVKTEAEIEAD